MKNYLKWLLLVVLALGGAVVWCRLALPRYQCLNLSVSQSQAVQIAENFLKTQRAVDVNAYKTAVNLDSDDGTDRYLQKTLGTAASVRLIHQLQYDLFWWDIRFFRERQKEEYRLDVSSATGQVIACSHIIEDTASRPFIDKEKARQLAFDFLKNTFGFSAGQYVPHDEDVKKYDNRIEYSFSWENKDINIPWDKIDSKGQAKLLTRVSVTGHEIRSFDKYEFDIPDGFNRYIDNLKQTGQNLTMVFRLLYLALITIAIVVVVNRKHQVVSRSVKPFYIGVGIAMFVLMVLDTLNNYQDILFGYPTTQSLGDYVVRQLVEGVIGPFFITVGFVLPALAGESLRFEVTPEKKNRGVLNTLLSSFCSITVVSQILVGYAAAAIMLGAQAFIFNLGFKYCGVWDELSWLTQASTSVVPAFSALVIGFQAGFSEETMFRLFAINLFKKRGVPTALAVFFAAAIWGFGHTGYEIFPMWFRGLEVTSIGLVMGFFYMRYGLLCVIVAHFLIDSFLFSLPYLLNPGLTTEFYTALLVIGLPLILAFIALIFNKNAIERPLKVRFNPQQEFNYRLLLGVCRGKTPEELALLKADLQHHGWDYAIIQRVFEEP